MGSGRCPCARWSGWPSAWFYFDLRCGFGEAHVYACSMDRLAGFQRIEVQSGFPF